MRNWTPEERQKQAEAIRRWKPWQASTGPRTTAGLSKSSQNARKHGMFTEAARQNYLEQRRSEKARWFMLSLLADMKTPWRYENNFLHLSPDLVHNLALRKFDDDVLNLYQYYRMGRTWYDCD